MQRIPHTAALFVTKPPKRHAVRCVPGCGVVVVGDYSSSAGSAVLHIGTGVVGVGA